MADHKRQRAFVADVLLYDRLIIPRPPDDKERQRWIERGWSPGRLDTYLRLLRDLVIPVDWNDHARELFASRSEAARAAAFDTQHFVNAQKLAQEQKQTFDPYFVTRALLTKDLRPVLPKDEPEPAVVAAYPSFESFRQDYGAVHPVAEIDEENDRKARLSSLLAHELLIPADDTRSDEDLLKIAVELAQDDEFRGQRARFYSWQDQAIKAGRVDDQALEEMQQHLKAYNRLVRRAVAKVQQRFVFTLVGTALGLAAAPLTPLGLAGAGLGLIQFAVLDRKPDIPADESAPAAMFHTARRRFGWRERAVG